MPTTTLIGSPDCQPKTWLTCAVVPPSVLGTGTDTAALDEFVDRLERHNPERTFPALENQNRAMADSHPYSPTDGRTN
jgi:hypothetical protein